MADTRDTQRHVLGEGCECVQNHSPRNYVPNDHHILPQSWGGRTVKANLIRICANTHTATHHLLDEYVRAGGDPGWEVRRRYGILARELAARAWAQRPETPTLTSVSHLAS